MMINRVVYLYWIGKEYKLISILRSLIYFHSNGNYTVVIINHDNIHQYIANIPDCFYRLCPAHQADYVRVNVICEYGGIWMDSDVIVMDNLSELFDIFTSNDGFFIIENNESICNGVFGSRAKTPLMLTWKSSIDDVLSIKCENIEWTEIGSKILQSIYDTNKSLYNNYIIYNGIHNMYPVNWNACVREFIHSPYNNYVNIVRQFQPIVMLVNSVYKELDHLTEEEILASNFPLNYFINKSKQNCNVIKCII